MEAPAVASTAYMSYRKPTTSLNEIKHQFSTNSDSLVFSSMWASTHVAQENPTLLCANNKGTDQTARMCSLISAFVVRFLKSIMTPLTTRKISIF